MSSPKDAKYEVKLKLAPGSGEEDANMKSLWTEGRKYEQMTGNQKKKSLELKSISTMWTKLF